MQPSTQGTFCYHGRLLPEVSNNGFSPSHGPGTFRPAS